MVVLHYVLLVGASLLSQLDTMAQFVLKSTPSSSVSIRPPFTLAEEEEKEEEENESKAESSSFEVEEISMEEDDPIAAAGVHSKVISGGRVAVQRANKLYSLAPNVNRSVQGVKTINSDWCNSLFFFLPAGLRQSWPARRPPWAPGSSPPPPSPTPRPLPGSPGPSCPTSATTRRTPASCWTSTR